jgi:Tol biopolymer transport system component
MTETIMPDPVRLTTDGTLKQDPVFLKGGEIVYTLLETPTQMRLMRLKPGDKVPAKLHPEATTNEFEVTFTADGGFYAFVQSRGNLNMKLVIRETATSKDAVFDPGGGFAAVRRPSIHPKGDRICFAIPTANGQEIASVGRDGKDRKTLTSGGINNWPAYSPDGKHIAFCSSRDGDFDLYVMNADGTNVKRVVKLEGMQARPCWSPDGKRLAFTWNRDGNYDIHAVNLDGTDLVRLTDHAERDDYPTWHPDGKSIAFVGERNGKFDLYSITVK